MFKKLRLSTAIVIVLVVLALVVVVYGLWTIESAPDPLAQFIVKRSCSFVEWGDFHAFACTDGFVGSFAPLAPSP
jgi:flagellar basal body-associated protein FliL